MDWMNRGSRPAPAAGQPSNGGSPVPTQNGKRPVAGNMKWAFVSLLFCGTILVVAVVMLLALGGGGKSSTQDKYLDKNQMQAVFLNGGQVYFGKIKNITDKYMTMSGIYYLRVNQQVQPNGNTASNQDISLVKLGCELHGPQDQMVINQDQVVFWENLKSDGQVAKAVQEYIKQNPNGQQCNTQSTDNSSSSNSGNTTNNTTTNTSTTKKQ